MRSWWPPRSRRYVCTGPGEVSSLVTDPRTPVTPERHVLKPRPCHVQIAIKLSSHSSSAENEDVVAASSYASALKKVKPGTAARSSTCIIRQ